MKQDKENHKCLLTEREYLQNLFVSELQAILRKCNLLEKGLKSDLINRIIDFHSPNSTNSSHIEHAQSEDKESSDENFIVNNTSKDRKPNLNELLNDGKPVDEESLYQRSQNYSKDVPNTSSPSIAQEPTPSVPHAIVSYNSHSLFPQINEDPNISESNYELLEELNPKKKRIPIWATDNELEKALRHQYSNPEKFDPDKIFSQAFAPDINTVFNSMQEMQKNNRGMHSRGSSSKWSIDPLTEEEIQAWRQHNGYQITSFDQSLHT